MTQTTDPRVTKAREDRKYIASLTRNDAVALSTHGDPKIREAAKSIAYMAERHDQGDFTPAIDAQDVDNIGFYASADEIRRALGHKEVA